MYSRNIFIENLRYFVNNIALGEKNIFNILCLLVFMFVGRLGRVRFNLNFNFSFVFFKGNK